MIFGQKTIIKFHNQLFDFKVTNLAMAIKKLCIFLTEGTVSYRNREEKYNWIHALDRGWV